MTSPSFRWKCQQLSKNWWCTYSMYYNKNEGGVKTLGKTWGRYLWTAPQSLLSTSINNSVNVKMTRCFLKMAPFGEATWAQRPILLSLFQNVLHELVSSAHSDLKLTITFGNCMINQRHVFYSDLFSKNHFEVTKSSIIARNVTQYIYICKT